MKRKGVTEDAHEFISAYRSFEGEVFENLIYENLLRYAKNHEAIEQFIIKGPHIRGSKALPNTLSVNSKGQIVYRTRQNEIGEFDGLFFTKKELFFVEMTLVKSVTNLRRRLRKKKALLETIFPQYKVKALLVLNEGVSGINLLPDYCTVWITRPFESKKVFEWISQPQKPRRKRFDTVTGAKVVGPEKLKIEPFNYYGTLSWILKKIRSRKEHVINTDFLKTQTFIRYHDLFTKIYIGYMDIKEFRAMHPEMTKPTEATRVYVSIEKEHTGASVLTYFLSHSRKKLDNIVISGGRASVQKKDPYGITVTEIAHMSKIMNPSHRLRMEDIRKIEKLLK